MNFATPFGGGQAAVHSFRTFVDWLVTFVSGEYILAECPHVSYLFFVDWSAVAVERVFSGGRDTVSLRRQSLKPETIRTLMIVRARLRLFR